MQFLRHCQGKSCCLSLNINKFGGVCVLRREPGNPRGARERRLAVLGLVIRNIRNHAARAMRYLTRVIPATRTKAASGVPAQVRGPVDGGAAALATRCEVAERSTITISRAA